MRLECQFSAEKTVVEMVKWNIIGEVKCVMFDCLGTWEITILQLCYSSKLQWLWGQILLWTWKRFTVPEMDYPLQAWLMIWRRHRYVWIWFCFVFSLYCWCILYSDVDSNSCILRLLLTICVYPGYLGKWDSREVMEWKRS